MLKQLIDELKSAQTALEMESIYQNEIQELKAIIAKQKDDLNKKDEELGELQDEVDNRPVTTEVDLGMDVLHYHFKNGNLDIFSKFEAFLKELQTVPGREL